MRQARALLIPVVWFLLTAQLVAAQATPATPPPFAPHSLPLAARINAVVSDTDLSRGFWGIEVASLENGQTLYSLNADKLFIPASNTKLFTTAAAMALIGPNYKIKTTIETAGKLDQHGRLTGNLVLVGRGDPNLSGRVLPYNLRTERSEFPIKALDEL